jgi:glyoxylase I family protein
VDDLDACLRRLEAGCWTRFAEKGGKRIYEVEGGRLLKVIAPEGSVIELRERNDI